VSERPSLMKCGCAPSSTHNNAHDGKDVGHWSCFVHSCCDVGEAVDLSQRKARCAYYGGRPHKNECSADGCRAGSCQCERPSDPATLPFFEYLGPGSPDSVGRCVCGFYEIAHAPLWTAHLDVDREWYKVGRKIHQHPRTFHAWPDDKEVAAEREANFFRGMTHGEARVYGVVVTAITPARSDMKCRTFKAKGPAEYDKFYCGCHGWD
jgi:hypothetical protein